MGGAPATLPPLGRGGARGQVWTVLQTTVSKLAFERAGNDGRGVRCVSIALHWALPQGCAPRGPGHNHSRDITGCAPRGPGHNHSRGITGHSGVCPWGPGHNHSITGHSGVCPPGTWAQPQHYRAFRGVPPGDLTHNHSSSIAGHCTSKISSSKATPLFN